jgi:hypothetical protein
MTLKSRYVLTTESGSEYILEKRGSTFRRDIWFIQKMSPQRWDEERRVLTITKDERAIQFLNKKDRRSLLSNPAGNFQICTEPEPGAMIIFEGGYTTRIRDAFKHKLAA